MTEKSSTRPIVFAVLLAIYFVAGKLGLRLAFINGSVSAVWAPTGIALAAFLIFGSRVWPAIWLGAFLVNATTTQTLVSPILIAVGNTAEGLVGAYLVNRFAGGCEAFQSAQSVFRFTALVALFSTTISATCGVTALVLTGHAQWVLYGPTWTAWWLGDLTGALVVCPLLILWSSGSRPWRGAEIFEATALLGLFVVVGLVVFAGFFPSDIKNYPLEFLVVPFLMWTAFRFGRREAATVIAILAVIAAWGTYHGFGPFARDTPNESFLLLQAFLIVKVVMTLALTAVVSAHRQAETQAQELAVMDSLTGLPNYRRLVDVLRAEVVRSARTRRVFSVLFLDLDGLKAINDRYGHLTGNRALRRVAETLQQSCRAMDTPARFGGDEFVLVLPETPATGAAIVAGRVAERVAADRRDQPVLSISTGIAEYPRDGETPTALLSAADGALYEAKGLAHDRDRAHEDRPAALSSSS